MKIGLLASGGVDSSVAMLKLAQQYSPQELEVYYLKIWLEDELEHLGACPWKEDLDYVQKTCNMFGLQCHVISLQHEYYERIVSYVLDALRKGRTPSPDILCNRHIKFGVFFDHVQESLDYVASGHYAQNFGDTAETYQLRCSPDPVKDQTYFLSQMKLEQLLRAQFPIGSMTKKEVRELAEQHQLPACKRRDSQGICFLGRIHYSSFIEHYLGTRKGKIVDSNDGTILGEHEGYWFYTIGQRKGIKLGNGPWYVTKKDIDENTIYVSRWLELEGEKVFYIDDANWIAAEPDEGRYAIKLRHAPEYHQAQIEKLQIGGRKQIQVQLEEADIGLASGQYAAFYRDNVCLGGGQMEVQIAQ